MLLSSPGAVQAMACANHSLQSYFSQAEVFGELIVFPLLNMDYIIFFNVVLKDLVNFLSITTKTFLNSC